MTNQSSKWDYVTLSQAWSASRATTLLSGLMTSPRWDVAIGLIQRLRESMGAANFASAENKFATPATAIAVMAHHLNLKKV